jgi:hypothetical protein
MQRRAVLIIGAAADEIFRHVEMDIALLTEPTDDFLDLGHHFGANAVAGEDKNGRVCHGLLQ